jgi:hypothetical protein
MTTILESALDYLRRGWSVIPIKPGTKLPAIATWKPFQTARATEETVRKWFRNGKSGIGIVCGAISGGLTVIDFDDEQSYLEWSKTHAKIATAVPTVKTARGYHVYVRTKLTKTAHLDGIDIKASGYVIAPPSVHPTGQTYRWLNQLNGQELTEITIENLGLDTRGARGQLDTGDTRHTEIHRKHTDTQNSIGRGGSRSVDDAIKDTLPTEAGQRNKRIFLLAVRLKAIYESVEDARPAVEKWYKAAKSVIKTKDFEITWIDFQVAWQKVRYPAGSGVLGQAIEAARRRIEAGEGIQQDDFKSYEVRLLIETCYELSSRTQDGTFYLGYRSAAKLMQVSPQTAGNILKALTSVGYIELQSTDNRKQRQATVYRWKGRQ